MTRPPTQRARPGYEPGDAVFLIAIVLGVVAMILAVVL